MRKSRSYFILGFFFGVLVLNIESLGATSAQAADWSCLGNAIALNADTNSPYAQLNFSFDPAAAPAQGWFLLDTGSNFSHLDISTEAAASNGTRPNPLQLDFFSTIPFPRFTWNDFSKFSLPFRQIGIIGTNVLAKNVYAIDFQHHSLYQTAFDGGCSADQLHANGLVSISTQGYYSDHLKDLFRGDHIRPSQANANQSIVPNVPTIPVQIGSATAIAQIDTGFDDRVHPFSVNMNPAFLKAVNADRPRLVLIPEMGVVSLQTCVSGAVETTTAYRLAPGETFDWLAADGSIADHWSNAIFFVKETPPAAIICGGISTWEIPAAQLGVSFLQNLGMLILNAHSQTVWVPQQN
jgi:hypothetical protein